MGAIVIAVRIQEDAKSMEIILATKDRSKLHFISGVPHYKPITVQLIFSMTVNAELKLYFPIGHFNWLLTK